MIVIGNGCRARGKLGQNNIESVISNKNAGNLSENNLSKNNHQKNNQSKNNSSGSVDNDNWWPGEIAVPAAANSNSKIAQKNNNQPQNNTNKNNDYSEIINPPRRLESFAIEPKQLDESSGKTEQVNNSESQNHKIAQPEKQQSNNTKNKTGIKTAAANESSEKLQNTANTNAGISLREFETILNQAKWQPNVQLEYWLNNGMKLPESKNTILSKERREQIKELNLSEKEKLKRNQNQKYIDELISTWRWYNNDIDELVKKQREPESDLRPVFPVDPKIFLEHDDYKKPKYNILRANAAILMGRCNDYDAVESLIEIVKNERLDGLRCAAVETLGKMDHVGFEILIPLLEFARKRNIVTKNQVDNKRNDNDSYESGNSGLDKKNQITVINKILWSELLTAIANKIETWEHPCFLDSLTVGDVEVRRTSARLWRLCSQSFWTKKQNELNYRNEKDQDEKLQKLPRRFIVFARLENDLQTRTEMITTLGIWKEAEILDIVTNDLNHADMRLRFAAIDAVTAAECKAAERILKEKLRDTSVKTRVKSAEALRKLGFVDDVLRLADDKEREVRIEAAKAIALAPNERTLELAQRYIENDHEDVKLAALYSLDAWDRIDVSGEVLIDALQNRSFKVRNVSAEILSGYFPAAVELLSKVSVSDKDKIKIVTKIKKQFNEYLQSLGGDSESIIVTNNTQDKKAKKSVNAKAMTNNKIKLSEFEINEVFELLERLNGVGLLASQKELIRRRLAGYGDRLLPVLEYLYENYEGFELPKLAEGVLGDGNEIFGLILLLDSESEAIRRKSASDLLRRSKVELLGGLAGSRILKRGLCESDLSMLVIYLGILRNSDAYNARYLAASILKSEFNSVELRRVACDVFGDVGCGHDLIIIAQILGDQRRDISHAAFVSMVKILGRLGGNEFEHERGETAAKLWAKFAACDLFTQIEISAAIYLLGDEAGGKSFIRESFSPDARIRMHVVNVLGVVCDSDFMPILIRYLDDKDTNVSQAALAVLPKIAGEDIGIIETKIPMEHELSQSQKKIARWKKWYKSNSEE
ncbi:MAG: hypothetical protein LBT09_09110 [Planctomycetaceae bacterium]|nr:hypothetical protein [Planctomycetaceae bacterium]